MSLVFIQPSYSAAVFNTRAEVFVFPFTSLKSSGSAEAANLLVRVQPCRIGSQCVMFPLSSKSAS